MAVRMVNPPPVKAVTCGTCKADLEYEYADVDSYSYRDYGGTAETYYRIACPSCKNYCSVSRWNKS